MKKLFVVTAFFEAVTGLGLILSPSVLVWILLGSSPSSHMVREKQVWKKQSAEKKLSDFFLFLAHKADNSEGFQLY